MGKVGESAKQHSGHLSHTQRIFGMSGESDQSNSSTLICGVTEANAETKAATITKIGQANNDST
jgi:hypothetical protein